MSFGDKFRKRTMQLFTVFLINGTACKAETKTIPSQPRCVFNSYVGSSSCVRA